MDILRTEGLYKTYNEGSENEVHALKPLDISIEEGVFYAIIGRSGSGKSTLLQILGGLDRPSGGKLYIGLAVSGIAVIIANLLLWGGISIYALLSDAVLGNLLWGYPWWLHFIACVVLAAIITALYILPMKSIQKYLPIENIKTRK